jgi:hypothetical protein
MSTSMATLPTELLSLVFSFCGRAALVAACCTCRTFLLPAQIELYAHIQLDWERTRKFVAGSEHLIHLIKDLRIIHLDNDPDVHESWSRFLTLLKQKEILVCLQATIYPLTGTTGDKLRHMLESLLTTPSLKDVAISGRMLSPSSLLQCQAGKLELEFLAGYAGWDITDEPSRDLRPIVSSFGLGYIPYRSLSLLDGIFRMDALTRLSFTTTNLAAEEVAAMLKHAPLSLQEFALWSHTSVDSSK